MMDTKYFEFLVLFICITHVTGYPRGFYDGYNYQHLQTAEAQKSTKVAEQEIMRPYEFKYESKLGDGMHMHEQRADKHGSVFGSYTIRLNDGRYRNVRYVADKLGFRAIVDTNEMGTENRDPAEVVMKSKAMSGRDAALKYGPRPGYRPDLSR